MSLIPQSSVLITMNLVSAHQMREFEQRANASGNSFAQMMERAGTLTAQAIMQRWDVRDLRVLALIGPGNNGGDGLVCARVLRDAGASVHLYIWKRAADTNDPNWNACRERDIPFTRAEDDQDFAQLKQQLSRSNLLLDALLGTGVTRALEGTLKTLLDTIRASLQPNSPAPSLISPKPFVLALDRSTSEALARPIIPAPDHPTTPSTDLPTTRFSPRPTIVALDLPTGLDPDTGALDPSALPADLTVTYAFPKIGHFTFPGADAVGELVIADIGISDENGARPLTQLATASEIRSVLPERGRNSNKGTFGKTMLACGSLNFTGAPVLAARAAGRIGAGLVTLAVPETIHPTIASKIDEATFAPLPDRLGDWRPRAANELLAALWDASYDSLLVGCGLGRAESTSEFLQRLLENLPKLDNAPSLVLDADALNLLSDIPEWWTTFQFASPPVLTPHPGEMARLLGTSAADVQKDRLNVALTAAQQWNAVVVLKGAFTVVASPGEQGYATVIPFANSALATAGTGDVLSGTIAGLLAQYHARAGRDEAHDSSHDAYNAAIAGAYVHALAGELAAHEIGNPGVVAGDLIARLPQAITRINAPKTLFPFSF